MKDWYKVLTPNQRRKIRKEVIAHFKEIYPYLPIEKDAVVSWTDYYFREGFSNATDIIWNIAHEFEN